MYGLLPDIKRNRVGAKAVLESGDKVVGTVRGSIHDLTVKLGDTDNLKVVQLDINNEEQAIQD